MRQYRAKSLVIFTFVWSLFVGQVVIAQRMPRENVVDVPAKVNGLHVSNLFQSNMVLQRDKPIHIWGWASPGEEITVRFIDESVIAKTSEDGRWQVQLSAPQVSKEPRQLSIAGKDKTLTLGNILVGDVWVLGGQSNMEFELAKVENGNLEIVSANFSQIRILTVPQGQGPEPNPNFERLHEWSDWFGRHFRKGDWDECTPEVARELSAIGYAFARRIHMASEVPIGVIDASRGGTTVETWTPISILRQMDSPSVKAKLTMFDEAAAAWNAEADLQKRIEEHGKWIQRQTAEGKPIPEDREKPPTDLRPGPIGDYNFPGHCYTGMIQPIEGLSVKGAIFHQGYNNAFDGSVGIEMYRDVFPEMIEAWRTAFDDPELPFGILSLCTDGYPQTRDDYCQKMFNAGVDLRAAQYSIFLNYFKAGDENIGFASTYDLRRRWYHPQVKIPAGERIARWALATQYGFGRQVEWTPPMLVNMQVQGENIILEFDVTVGDPQDGRIEGFAIAGADREFHPANVAYVETGKDARGRQQFDKKRLVLSSPMVLEPIHYRYAWGRNPLANLQAMGNKDLPLATQRSDDWPMEFVPRGIVADGSTLPISREDRGKILQALRAQDRERRLAEAQAVLDAEG